MKNTTVGGFNIGGYTNWFLGDCITYNRDTHLQSSTMGCQSWSIFRGSDDISHHCDLFLPAFTVDSAVGIILEISERWNE